MRSWPSLTPPATHSANEAEIVKARFAIAAMFGANGLIMGAWAPQIPLLLTSHSISKTFLGLLILLLGLGAVSAMLFAGRLISRHGSGPIVVAFSLAIIPALPLIVFAPSIWLLALIMTVFGGVIGSMDVAINANAVEVERKLGKAMMSSSHGFWSLGGFIGGAMGSWGISALGAGPQALLTAAFAGTIILCAIRFLRADPAQNARSESRESPESTGAPHPKASLLPKDAGIWVLGAMALFAMMPEGAVLDWAAIYLKEEMNAGTIAGLGFAFFSGTMAIMRFLGDGLRNRLGAVKTLQISGVLGAAGMMLAALSPMAELAIFGFAVAGLGIANMVPILFSAAGNYPGQAPGVAISAVTMVGYAGILVAPATIGFLAEIIGFRPTYGALALLLGCVTLLAHRASLADGQAHG